MVTSLMQHPDLASFRAEVVQALLAVRTCFPAAQLGTGSPSVANNICGRICPKDGAAA